MKQASGPVRSGCVYGQASVRRIETIDHHSVQFQVSDQGKAVIGRDSDGMSVGAALAIGVDTRSVVLGCVRG